MRFQGLAVVLGKKHWPELIARQRKKDQGLDAYAPASLTSQKIGKGLAASITPKLIKISDDAKKAKENFPDLKTLLFVTVGKVSNTNRKKWEDTIQKDHGLQLHIIEREEIIALMMMPENAALRASFLQLGIDSEPQVADLIGKTRRAAATVARNWAGRTKGRPLIELTAERLDLNGEGPTQVLSLGQMDQALSKGWRIILEGPAGCGKTTTLIQLAIRTRTTGTPFMVDFPAWASSRLGILDYIAEMPAFQAEGLTATELARLQMTEPFLFLLNGWNEVSESNSAQANNSLRELERDFPSAGIIVATRAHHLKAPLPGALRLRLLPLGHKQRADYLVVRLGAKSDELSARIDADRSLNELTRTPLILAEVATLFEAGAKIPSTKIDILAQVLHLHERREEHRNPLQSAPLFGRQSTFLKALATEMTRQASVELLESDGRTIVATVTRKLASSGQIEPAAAPTVLATLTAHHVLELVDYPRKAFRFEHQLLQEYFAALDVRMRLQELRGDDHDLTDGFTSEYVNDPAWAEPLRMIAAAIAVPSGDPAIDMGNTRAGVKLVQMALTVDLVFAGEIAYLCGLAVWNEVSSIVGERLRSVHAIPDRNYQNYAVAAMLATGAHDFHDIIAALLSSNDRQTRLRTYRLWPDFRVSLLGTNWRDQVRGWSEDAQTDFVSELLHHRMDGEVTDLAVEHSSIAVKKAAAAGLAWTRSEDALTRVLASMDLQTFEDVARKNAGLMPTVLRSKTIEAMRNFVETSTDQSACLSTALDLIELGETGLDGVIKDALETLSRGKIRSLEKHNIQPALKHLRNTDPAWVSEWVAIQISEDVLYAHDYWLRYATTIPEGIVKKCLQRIGTEDLKNTRLDGMIAVIAGGADEKLAARVFSDLRELSRKVDEEPGQRLEFERQVIRQLEAVFRRLPDDIAAAGVISSVKDGDALDIKVASRLLSRVARLNVEPICIIDKSLKVRLRNYLKGSVDLVLRQVDYNGEEKAHLASSIAQVGKPEDIADLVRLISADIERMRRAAGDDDLLRYGARMSYARWHIAAVMHLDPNGADQILIDLLPEPEYVTDVASAMTRDFIAKPERSFDAECRYELIRAAREGRTLPPGDETRRTRFVAALKAEIKRHDQRNKDGKSSAGLKELANTLAAIDGRGSATTVLDVIAVRGEWDQYTSVDAAERLLLAGADLPATIAFNLVDSILDRIEKWMQDSDKYLLSRILSLCPFVDDPASGIAKVRYMLRKGRLSGYELREIVTALGKCRSDAAIDLLYELASNAQTMEQCEDEIVNAIAAIDTPRTHDMLLGSVHPDIGGIALTPLSHRDELLVARLTELAQRRPEAATRLRKLCERDLPEINRDVLSRVMVSLGTSEALAANLNLIDDSNSSPIPQGVWDQLETAFVEQRPYGQNTDVFTEHARPSNELRGMLFRMALQDPKRRKSAFMLLGKIEASRIEHGRPIGEPRHPDLASGQSWPLAEP